MYKDKYLKYKKKYLELKNIRGGTIPENNLFKYLKNKENLFKKIYNIYKTKINSLDILLKLLEISYLDEIKSDPNYNLNEKLAYFKVPNIKILIGATSNNLNDFNRFENSEDYSLYVDDTINLDTDLDNTKDEAKQFKMFSIEYKHLLKFIKDKGKNYIYNELKHNTDEIHFDRNVSYFTDIDYFLIASYLLKPGGKMIWSLDQQAGTYYFNHFNINKTDMTIVPYKSFFTPFENIKLTPQKPTIIISQDNNQFSTQNYTFPNFFEIILEYFSVNFTDFNFELKEFSYIDYNYNVPITPIYKKMGHFLCAIFSYHKYNCAH